MEGQAYYAGLHSLPKLVYRTSKEKWAMSTGPWTVPYKKQLREVFTHPITKVWNHDLGWKVVEVLDANTVHFTTIDVVRFKMVGDEYVEDGLDDEELEAKKLVGPVTIWIGVFPDSISATIAHDVAQDLLALLKDYNISDVDIDFRESYYTREVGPPLHKPVDPFHPLADILSPITPTLGLPLSNKDSPDTQGTMAVYLAEGGESDVLLGLSCRHVLIGSKEANVDYVRHPSQPPKEVLLLSNKDHLNLIASIKCKIAEQVFDIRRWKEKIASHEERGTVPSAGISPQLLVDNAEKMIEALEELHLQVRRDWKKHYIRALGHIICSPAICLGVGEHHFTEDWGIFQVDRSKLGDGFQGNKIDLGTKLGGMAGWEFKKKTFTTEDADYIFPESGLLPLVGTLTDEMMRTPDKLDSDGEPCLLVVKRGNASDTTIGRANGVFSIVRDYYHDMSIHQTSMEWAIINYGYGTDGFSKPGDSGAIIADIHGRIGGMLTGGSGSGYREFSDITYATPFWWLLERIKANGFPNAHPDVLADMDLENLHEDGLLMNLPSWLRR